MFKDVKKAVIPAAGLGVRLRPLTTYLPKELLPIGGKPMIQYTFEMYMASGISEFCIITSPHKPMLRTFITGNWKPPALPFHRDAALYRKLAACRMAFLTQDEPRGVADAVALARDFVGDEPFACIMPDCLLFSNKPLAQQLLEGCESHQRHVIGSIYIRGSDARRFGNVGVLETERLRGPCFAITSLSDKKQKKVFDRDFFVVGDFNIKKAGDKFFKALKDRDFQMPAKLDSLTTNFLRTGTYDKIAWVDEDDFDFSGKTNVVPYYKAVYQEKSPPGGKQEISDHLPLWAEFKVNSLNQQLNSATSCIWRIT